MGDFGSGGNRGGGKKGGGKGIDPNASTWANWQAQGLPIGGELFRKAVGGGGRIQDAGWVVPRIQRHLALHPEPAGGYGVQRKESGGGEAAGGVKIPEGGGAKLPGGVQAKMQQKLGADLSDVNIHTGGESAKASEDLNARAFTTGADVHFGAGEFDPSSKEGEKLLAHELTHVAQNKRGGGVQRTEESEGEEVESAKGEQLEVSDPDEPAEKEADAKADEIVDGEDGADEDAGDEPKEGGDDAKTARKLMGGVHRKVFLAKRPTPSPTTPATQTTPVAPAVSASRMFSPHDTTKNAFANIKKVWDKTVRQQKLRVGSPEEEKLSKDRAALQKEYDDKEAEYQAVKGAPTVATVQAMVTFYTSLSQKVAAFLTGLEDFTKTAEEKSAIAEALMVEIRGSRESARSKTPDPNTIPVLQLPDFKSHKDELVAAWTAVKADEAAETAKTAPLEKVREFKVNADRLRTASDTAVKLSQLPNAMERFTTSIKDIIDQNEKEGAEVGNGTSEAAAIQEARTGVQVKNRWHGPKCRMDATGLTKNADSLEALKAAFPDPAAIAKIDAEIKKARDRAKGLEAGATAWAASPHYRKAEFKTGAAS